MGGGRLEGDKGVVFDNECCSLWLHILEQTWLCPCIMRCRRMMHGQSHTTIFCIFEKFCGRNG